MTCSQPEEWVGGIVAGKELPSRMPPKNCGVGDSRVLLLLAGIRRWWRWTSASVAVTKAEATAEAEISSATELNVIYLTEERKDVMWHHHTAKGIEG